MNSKMLRAMNAPTDLLATLESQALCLYSDHYSQSMGG